MAVVQGIKEKVHLPIYDSIKVEAGQQLREVENSNVLKFFVDVQGKTKLETNLQSASLLPHYNTFEARAMRVVVSDLRPEFPKEDIEDEPILDFLVTDDEDRAIDKNGGIEGLTTTGLPTFVAADAVTADIKLSVSRLVELLVQARKSEDGFAALDPDDEGVTLHDSATPPNDLTDDEIANVIDAGGAIWLSEFFLQGELDNLPEEDRPLDEQIEPNNGAGTLIGKLIYNTVTTLYVGEKAMIQMPTFFFPGGAGPYSESGSFTTHGEPSPVATFRFAEPVFIERNQNFRVEIEVPHVEVFNEIKRIYGPFQTWVILDGYMTRDVQ
jgi:hypothetical protein